VPHLAAGGNHYLVGIGLLGGLFRIDVVRGGVVRVPRDEPLLPVQVV